MSLRRPRLFVSYRRSDSEGSSGRLADALAWQFGRQRVFLDSARIPFGADFVRIVGAEIARADVVLAVIGPQWLDAGNARGRRLDQDDDPVRHELELALRTDKRIVPVLVDEARMPGADALPPTLAALARRNAATLRNASFASDFELLVDELLGRPRGALRSELDRLRRRVAGAGAAALVVPMVAALAALGAWTGVFDVLQLDTHAQAALLAPLRPAGDGPVLLVTIDAESEQRLGRRWPEPRAAWRADHARLVDRAAAAGARAVVFDLAFDCRRSGDNCAGELAALAAAAARAAQRTPATRVVWGVRDADAGGRPLLAEVLRGSGGSGNVCLFDRGGGALWSVPLAVLDGGAGASAQAAAGRPALALAALLDPPVVGVDLERRHLIFDGAPREPPLRYSTIERRREALPACPLIKPGELAATLIVRPAPAGYWGAAGQGGQGAGRRVSYAAVLNPGLLPDAALAGRVLLVGVTTGHAGDVFLVRQGLDARLVHGVELHADAITAIAAGRAPQLASADQQALGAGVLALAGAAAAVLVERAAILWATVAVLGGAWGLLCVVLARHGLLFAPAYALVALTLAALAVQALLGLLRRVRARRGR